MDWCVVVMVKKILENKAEKVLTIFDACGRISSWSGKIAEKKRKKRNQEMEIKVINNVPGIKVTVNKSEDGSFAVLLAQENRKTLGDVACGSVVKIGNREYIVLEHSKETTAVIAKQFAKTMEFGKDGNYLNSDVRKYCNGDYLKELASAVGEDNIVPHTVKLVADDGTGKDVTCKDKVSILTTDLYRRYREFLPAYGSWWWTATRVNTTMSDYARCVCCVFSNGVLDWRGCVCCVGVRPFCILNSSVLVSCNK